MIEEKVINDFEMEKTDLAYSAGLFDGEGCITIANKIHKRQLSNGIVKVHKYHELRVDFVNTNEWVCRQFQFSFGGSLYCHKYKKPRQPCWQCCLVAKQAMAFLEAVLPYLKIKKPQAEIGINFERRKLLYGRGSKRLTEKERVMREASRILISNLNNPLSKLGKHD